MMMWIKICFNLTIWERTRLMQMILNGGAQTKWGLNNFSGVFSQRQKRAHINHWTSRRNSFLSSSSKPIKKGLKLYVVIFSSTNIWINVMWMWKFVHDIFNKQNYSTNEWWYFIAKRNFTSWVDNCLVFDDTTSSGRKDHLFFVAYWWLLFFLLNSVIKHILCCQA
jgi:hypothetical protein